MKSIGKYTWQQVSVHNTDKSCWIINDKQVYDITPFLSRHPGGKNLLLLAGGRDCTNLIPSYHWWTDSPQKVLDKYKIGELEGENEFPSFPPDSGLYADMVEQVKRYFETTGKDPKDPLPGAARLGFQFAVAATAYYVCYMMAASVWVKVLAAVVFGVFQALPLLHAMHDASHTGASINSWMHQHVLSHHLYTNIGQVDSDLPLLTKGDIRRIAPHQLQAAVYRLQWLYLPLLYSLLGLKFRIQDIADTLITQTNGALRVSRIGLYHVVQQILVKLFWLYWRLYVPIYSLNNPLSLVLALFLTSELVTGLWLSWNFQVSHVSTVAKVYDKSDDLDEWAVLQIKSSVDYSHGDSLMTFLCGALNYQTIHHLFPAISQYHYPALTPLLMAVAKKHGVEFNVLNGFKEAFSAHIDYLVLMGKQDIKLE